MTTRELAEEQDKCDVCGKPGPVGLADSRGYQMVCADCYAQGRTTKGERKMKVISTGALIYKEPWPATTDEVRQRHDQIIADLDAPMEMGTALKVAHDSKTDRYTITFRPADDKSLALKATDEVAAFVAEHIAGPGYWRGRMINGWLMDVYLIQV